MLLAAGFLGGALYLYTSVGEEASQEMVVETGLTKLAFSLWNTGTAPGANMVDTDLVKTIEGLHGKYRAVPELLIVPAEGKPGERLGTHVIQYLSGPRIILSVVVNVDLTEGRADILSHTTKEEIDVDAGLDPAEELLKNFGKRKPADPASAGTSRGLETRPQTAEELLENFGKRKPAPEVEPMLPEKVSEEPRKGDE